MVIDLDKTKIINGRELEQVKEFVYFGSTLIEAARSEREVKVQNGKAATAL